MQKADQAYASGKLEEAALYYRKALQKNEAWAVAWYRLGLCEEKRDISAAYLSFRQAAMHEPQLTPAQVRLAELEIQQYFTSPTRSEKLAGTIRQRLDNVRKDSKFQFDAFRLEAQFQFAQARPEAALAAFDKAISLNASDAGVRLGRAQVLFLMKRDGEAFAMLEEIMKVQPRFLPAFDLAVFHYNTQNKNDDTERVLRKRLESNADDEQSYLQLVAFYLKQNQREKTQLIEKQLLAESKRFPDAAIHLADTYSRANDIDAAVRLLTAVRNSNPQRADEYDKQIAMSYLASQNFGEARRRIEAYLQKHPQDQDAKGALAILKVRVKSARELPEAVRTLEKLVQADPRSSVYLYNLALGQEAKRDWRAARSSLRKLLRNEPGNLEALAALARISLRVGDFTEAMQLSQKILEFEPNHEEAQINLAVSSAGQGQIDLAVSRFRDLIKRFPKSREVRIQYGLVSILQKNYPEAEALLRAELQSVNNLTNDDLRILEGLSQIWQQQGQPEKAYRFVTQLADANPGIPGLAMLAGQSALRNQKPEIAMQYFQRVSSSDGRIARAEVKMLMGSPAEAVELLDEVVKNDPGHAVAWAMLGSGQSQTGQFARAIESYRQSIAINPQQPSVLNNIAYLIVESQGNLDEAVVFANSALQQLPDQPEFADTLGMAYLAKGQIGAAREIFHRLSVKVPNNAMYHLHLARALEAEGNIPQAISALRTASKHATDDKQRRDIDAIQAGLGRRTE